jgi:hypothetical protein
MKKSDLIPGKHIVKTVTGKIGLVMESGIVFSNISIMLGHYREDLILDGLVNVTVGENEDYEIIEIMESKSNSIATLSGHNINTVWMKLKKPSKLEKLKAKRDKLDIKITELEGDGL